MSRGKNKKIFGFTLIEVVVVVGVVAIVLIVSAGVMTNSLRSSTRVETTSRLEGAATWMLSEIKRNTLMAIPRTITCPSGVGFSFTNKNDNRQTSIACFESPVADSRIASASSYPSRISPENIHVKGCNNFVTCETDPLNPSVVTAVRIGFTLFMGDGAGPIDQNYQRSFSSIVTLRD